jgi:hypothetical protein
LARFFDQGVATFEEAVHLLPYMAIGIQMPIWVVGIEPDDFSEVRSHYDAMFAVATANGVACHSFESVWGAAMPIDEPGSA